MLAKLHYRIVNTYVAGMEDPASYPEYVLAIHSSKRLLVEQISPPAYVLADAIISLTLAKGQRHEVCGQSPSKPDSHKIFMRVICKVHGLTLLLQVRTLWRCGDSLFFEVPPLASDALLFHPLLKNVLQTVESL
jgi:hypothetical protein